MFEMKTKCTFDAAHRVPGYPGKCDRLHGHTWTAAARVRGEETDDLGMLVDFRGLRNALKEVTDAFDHQYLNELSDFAGVVPSAENIARIIYKKLSSSEIFSGQGAWLYDVEVWESPHSSVRYFEKEES